jgi:hypothetical protein
MEFHDAKFFTCDNFTFVQWKSNRLLQIISNYYGPFMLQSENHKLNNKPEMVYYYNVKARGVDRNN